MTKHRLLGLRLPQAILGIVAVSLLAMDAPGETHVLYTITDLGTPGGARSIPYSINNSGQVAGRADLPTGSNAFFYSEGVMADLGTLDDDGLNKHGSCALALNDNDQVVGWAGIDSLLSHAFLWSPGGTLHDLGSLNTYSSAAYGVNNQGQIVGQNNYSYSYAQAVMWEDGQIIPLSPDRSNARAINETGQIVGQNNGLAVIWNEGMLQTLPQPEFAYSSTAYDINDHGQAVGSASNYSRSTSHALLWEGGDVTDLGTLNDASYSRAHAINNSSQVVGESYYSAGDKTLRACLWEDGVVYDLNDLLVEGHNWGTLWSARGINDQGQIVGEGYTLSGSSRGFLLTPVAEPATLSFLGLGLGWLLHRRRAGV